MPSTRFLLLCCALALLSTNSDRAFATAKSSSTEGVGSYILQGLGASDSTATTATSISSPYYSNTSTSSTSISTISPSSSSTSVLTTSSDSISHTSYTTFTSLCTDNGTTVIHTHSAAITGDSTSSSTAEVVSESSSASVTAIYISSTTQLVNSSSSEVSQSSLPPKSNATLPSASNGGVYTSGNGSASAAPYTSSSVSGSSNSTNSTAAVPSGYITASTGQQTLTTAAPWTVANNGTGLAYASACNDEWQSYFELTTEVQSESSLQYMTTYTITNYTAPLTTLCDGNTQIDGPLVSTGTVEISQTSYSVFYNATVTLPPAPTCTVPKAQCSAIGFDYSIGGDIPPGCSGTSSCTPGCTIKGSDIQVIYFPPSTTANATRDVCTSSTVPNNDCPYGSWVTSTTTSTDIYSSGTSTGSSTREIDYGSSTATVTDAVSSFKDVTTVVTQTMSECVYSKAGPEGYSNGETNIYS